MQALVVYDSQYGNTEKVAMAIADALGGDAIACHVSEADPSRLPTQLLVVGSPTQGGRPTQATKAFLAKIEHRALKGVTVAAFDTRIPTSEHGFALRFLMGLIGYAAPRIAGSLKAKGGELVAQPEAFFVDAKEGPLQNGELEHAARWARTAVRRTASV